MELERLRGGCVDAGHPNHRPRVRTCADTASIISGDAHQRTPAVRAPMYPDAMRLEDVLTVLDALERAGVRYAVFGGLAMAAHGFDRATRDLDLFVAPDVANVERLREALTAEDLGGAYPAVQYGPPDVDFTIDIVSRLGDAFRFEDLEVERVLAGTLTITVVTPETLYRMKRDTVRLRDRDDAQRLAHAYGFDSGEDR